MNSTSQNFLNHESLFVSYDKIHKQGKTISNISYIIYIMFCTTNLNLKKNKTYTKVLYNKIIIFRRMKTKKKQQKNILFLGLNC